MITVAVADDQELIRTALRDLIDHEADMTFVGHVGDGAAAVELARSTRPAVMLMDIRMPGVDGIEATRCICSDPTVQSVRVLILTTFEEDEYIVQALKAGASGFIGKGVDAADIMRAIRTVNDGEALLSPVATRSLITRFIHGNGLTTPTNQLTGLLTERELEVLTLVARGLANHEIAAELSVATSTTKTHVNRIMSKLGAHDRAQLVIRAYEDGLVQPGT